MLRQDIASQKRRLIAANLSLAENEAAKFWPVYDEYQAEYTKIGDAKVTLFKEYAQNGDRSLMNKRFYISLQLASQIPLVQDQGTK